MHTEGNLGHVTATVMPNLCVGASWCVSGRRLGHAVLIPKAAALSLELVLLQQSLFAPLFTPVSGCWDGLPAHDTPHPQSQTHDRPTFVSHLLATSSIPACKVTLSVIMDVVSNSDLWKNLGASGSLRSVCCSELIMLHPCPDMRVVKAATIPGRSGPETSRTACGCRGGKEGEEARAAIVGVCVVLCFANVCISNFSSYQTDYQHNSLTSSTQIPIAGKLGVFKHDNVYLMTFLLLTVLPGKVRVNVRCPQPNQGLSRGNSIGVLLRVAPHADRIQ